MFIVTRATRSAKLHRSGMDLCSPGHGRGSLGARILDHAAPTLHGSTIPKDWVLQPSNGVGFGNVYFYFLSVSISFAAWASRALSWIFM
jgi:hypothetical protein